MGSEWVALIAINFLVVLSLWIPIYSGVISLGLAGFMVAGGLVSGYLSIQGMPLVVCILAGTASGAVLGLGPALLALRVKAMYLAIATLAFAELTLVGVRNLEVVGGVQGLSGFEPISETILIVLAAVALIGATIFFMSRRARVCEASAQDPVAAASCGISVAKYQIVMTVLGAAVSGLAGALYAHYYGYVGPSSFGFPTVVRSLIFLIVGGMTPIGAALGATVFTILPQYLDFLEGWMDAVYAAVVLIILVFLPQGLISKRRLSTFLWRPIRVTPEAPESDLSPHSRREEPADVRAEVRESR